MKIHTSTDTSAVNRPPDAETIPISYGAASAVTQRYIKDEEPAHRVASEPN